ncbi:MAG: zinc ABC transporter substrate-binding protein [Proteobacteria bacterium]|nr:zinc ABC transporter substrate-binding protein [Pseudomonadota bacterium]
MAKFRDVIGVFLVALIWAAPARAEGVKAVASIAPVHSLLAQVMEGAGRPRLLLPGGSSPHAYALKPSAARALAEAQVVFWVGPGLERFLVKPLSSLPRRVMAVELATAEGVKTRRFKDAGGGEGGTDPHVWLDPRNAAAMTRFMAAVMANADPANAVLYRDNGAALRARLGKLEAELRQTLEPVTGVPYLAFHDAFGYFEDRFGLQSAGAVTAAADRPPGAKRISALRRLIKTEKIPCVFTEPEFEPALARTLIEGSKARIGILDPLGAGLKPGPGLYAKLMRGLARSFVGCLKDRP